MASDEGERTAVRWGFGDACIGFALAYILVALLQPVIYKITGQSLDTNSSDLPLSTRALSQVPFYGGMLGWALYASIRKGRGPVEDYGLRVRALDVPLGLGLGVITQFAVVPLLWVVQRLSDTSAEDIEKPARELTDRAHGIGVVLLILVVVVAAPIVEEIFFRGLVMRSLERRLGTGWAVVLSSAIFAASHFELLQFAALFVFGLVAAILAVRTGRLGASMFAHLAFNATTVIILLR